MHRHSKLAVRIFSVMQSTRKYGWALFVLIQSSLFVLFVLFRICWSLKLARLQFIFFQFFNFLYILYFCCCCASKLLAESAAKHFFGFNSACGILDNYCKHFCRTDFWATVICCSLFIHYSLSSFPLSRCDGVRGIMQG